MASDAKRSHTIFCLDDIKFYPKTKIKDGVGWAPMTSCELSGWFYLYTFYLETRRDRGVDLHGENLWWMDARRSYQVGKPGDANRGVKLHVSPCRLISDASSYIVNNNPTNAKLICIKYRESRINKQSIFSKTKSGIETPWLVTIITFRDELTEMLGAIIVYSQRGFVGEQRTFHIKISIYWNNY